MNLSDNTIDILKNFSLINPSIKVDRGSTLKTISPSKTIIATAQISEEFEQDFAIYDLTRFLGLLTLFDETELEFGKKLVTISGTSGKVQYKYADPSMIITPPTKELKRPETKEQFTLTEGQLRSVLKAAALLQTPEIAFRSEAGLIKLCALDSKNPGGDDYTDVIGTSEHNFEMYLKEENLKLISNTYKVSVGSKNVAIFEAENLSYWVATERNSTFGE